jgi:hypothetical protein
VSADPANPKLQELSDGGGIQLRIDPTGGRWCRLAFRFKGKQKLLAPGVYPAVSLADARQARAMPSSGRPCSRAPARLGGS